MPTNTEIEMRWVDAWNDVHDVAREHPRSPCRLPDGTVVTVEACLHWLQSAVYAGEAVRVETGWVDHRKGVVVHRSAQRV